ncbi:MAG: hypothetical protein ACXWP4_20760 [Polyangiales bacterium]
MLREPDTGSELSVDARLTCVPSTAKYRDRPELADHEIDRRDLVELATVVGGAIYLDDPMGGHWHRYEIVVPARLSF